MSPDNALYLNGHGVAGPGVGGRLQNVGNHKVSKT